MIFVRGIMGNIKLNPAIKLWGGLILALAGTSFTLFVQFANYREDVAACEEQAFGLAGFRPGSARYVH